MKFINLFIQFKDAMLTLFSDYSSMIQPVLFGLNIFQLLAVFGLSGIIAWAIGKAAIKAFLPF